MKIFLYASLFALMIGGDQGFSRAAQAQTVSDSKFPLFENAAAAQHHCPFDTVVWLDIKSDTYNIGAAPAAAAKNSGAYMCQRDADQMDYHLAPQAQ